MCSKCAECKVCVQVRRQGVRQGFISVLNSARMDQGQGWVVLAQFLITVNHQLLLSSNRSFFPSPQLTGPWIQYFSDVLDCHLICLLNQTLYSIDSVVAFCNVWHIMMVTDVVAVKVRESLSRYHAADFWQDCFAQFYVFLYHTVHARCTYCSYNCIPICGSDS